MPDLTDEILLDLKTRQLPGLGENEGWQLPDTKGFSLQNLPSSICHLLNVPEIRGARLHSRILSSLKGQSRCLVAIIVDALSLHCFQNWVNDGTAPIWKQLQSEGVLAPLTSLVPSTTSTVLPTLWTGCSPAEHGLLGYELWLKEYGIVTNMITQSPITFKGETISMERAGLEPEKLILGPLLGSHLKDHGIESHAFLHYTITRSGLSRSFLHDVELHSYSTATDLWITLRKYLEEKADKQLFAWVYWGALDGLSHRHGPDDERIPAEFALFSTAFERSFLSKLSAKARNDTVLMLSSDHGQIATPPNRLYDLRNHVDFTRRLHLMPTGENRLIYLFVRPGQIAAVSKYIEETWPDQFRVIPSVNALQTGLFGDGLPHPRVLERIGDLILIPTGNAYLWWAEKENPLHGRHGGLSPDEMLVPFLAAHL
ncbi:MAG: alkaline phosphatase family protein [Chloroflexota bacterium]